MNNDEDLLLKCAKIFGNQLLNGTKTICSKCRTKNFQIEHGADELTKIWYCTNCNFIRQVPPTIIEVFNKTIIKETQEKD